MKEPLKQQAVGKVRVRKQFVDDKNDNVLSWFEGKVTEYDARNKRYLVVYSDGDCEHMTWPQLRTFMLQDCEAAGSNQQHTGKPAQTHKPGKASKRQEAPTCSKEGSSVPDTHATQQDQMQHTAKQQHQQSTYADASHENSPGVESPGLSPSAAAAAAPAGSSGPRKQMTARKTSNGVVKAAAAAAAVSTAAAAGKGTGQEKKRKTMQQQQQQQQQQQPPETSVKSSKKAKAAAGSAAGVKRKQSAAAATATEPAKKKQRKPKQPKNSAGAGAAAAADTGGGTSKKDTKAKKGKKANQAKKDQADRVKLSLQTFPPARVLQDAYEQRCVSLLTALTPEAVDAAAPVQTTEEGLPLWQLDDSSVKVFKGDVMQHLQETATEFAPGTEPWRRFIGVGPNSSALAAQIKAIRTAAAAEKKAAAAIARQAQGKSSKSNKKQAAATSAKAVDSTTAVAAAAAAVGKDDALTEEAAAAAVAAGKVLLSLDEQFADADAELANAIKLHKAEFQKEYRLGICSEELRVQAIKAAQAAAEASSSGASQKQQQQDDDDDDDDDDNDDDDDAEEEEGGDGEGSGDDDDDKAGDKKEKKPSQRPDRVAESIILRTGRAVNDRDSWGHVPGIKINNTFMLRSEASVIGVHKSPIGGIVSGTIPVPIVVGNAVYKDVRAATSVVMSGCYEDDHDAASDIVKYTGEGGNDLLGRKLQVANQTLKRGNKALMANIALGLPVRVLRRNDDCNSATNSVLFYDGLYDVVSWVKALGKQEKVVYIFGLKRRHGQEESLSKPIPAFKAVGTAKLKMDAVCRKGIVCKDLSKGKEATPVVVVNEVDRELPPGLSLPEDAEWIIDDKSHIDGPLVASSQPFRYITENEYDADVPPPRPPRLLEEDSSEAAEALAAATAAAKAAAEAAAGAAADCAAAADGEKDTDTDNNNSQQQQQQPLRARACKANAGSSGGSSCCSWYSKEWVVKKAGERPHELLARLNFGELPYIAVHRPEGSKKSGPQLPGSRCCPVITECGEWMGCTEPDCVQRQASRGVRYRLEVFKTRDGRGWGVRSWDTVRAGTLVCIMWGKIVRAEHVCDDGPYNDSGYFFDLTPRPAGSCDGKYAEQHHEVKYVLCAKEQGGVARFINHSCDPNLYVQPLRVGHTDDDMVAIGLFASTTVPPFTELAYDYGSTYIADNLDGVCLCGADCCKFKPQQQQPQQHLEQAQQCEKAQ